MARRTHDIIADIGEYEKDGETKKRWQKVGVMFDNGAIKIDTIPITKEWSGWLKAVEPYKPEHKARKPVSEFNDDIPF